MDASVELVEVGIALAVELSLFRVTTATRIGKIAVDDRPRRRAATLAILSFRLDGFITMIYIYALPFAIRLMSSLQCEN